ncbi:UDP-glucoronosyl and UDP-glucosyl transferase [Necator americanus]|uniref:glucuronosyltransferase n=1 Tax=Necator americanus TaxID=51031 RepID=W2TQ90_NECAM|nr:UDP-glucoronosyl and UDP-glucosyl transferase [Necator americanus]ETN84240.1 UDP-glucoronosyl and UDP-glucosyl transferase [Necator americanus]
MASSFVLLLFSLFACNGYKILVYSPIIWYSHTNFMGTLADILTEAGHNVLQEPLRKVLQVQLQTVLMPLMDPAQKDKTRLKTTKNIIMVPTDPRVLQMKEFEKDILSDIWNMKPSIFELNRAWAATNMQAMFPFQCERVIDDKPLMERLEKEKFDLGMAEFISACGLGIIEAVKIPASVVVYSVVYHDLIAQLIGEPSIPSYVPGCMSASSDRMNLLERFKNAVDMIFGHNFFLNMYRREIEVIRARFGSDFKNYEQLVVESSLVLSNSNPYLDFPRPMLYKTVPIGGITFSKRIENNKLSEIPIFADQLRNANMLARHGGAIVLSKFDLENKEKLKNSLLSLLNDERRVLVLFCKCSLEFSEMVQKPVYFLLRCIVKLNLKFSLPSISSYSQNAKRLSEMLRNQPISPKELFIRHIEFAARYAHKNIIVLEPGTEIGASRFGRLPNLISYGTQLSFLQYYFLDIFLAFFLTIIAAIYLIFKTFSKCFPSSPKIKND